LVHNKTNDGIVFPVDHQKTVVSKAFLLATKPMTVLSFLWMAKKIVSKVFRFATKPTTVLSFLWITKKCLKALPDRNKTNYVTTFSMGH
jgi:hypothetical protein